jgi:ParB family chromosome partitioning protein
MSDIDPRTAELVSISTIHVLNARGRNQAVFNEIVQSIAKVGLKRPITVSRRSDNANGMEYDLVCGQGRIEAFRALGQTEIPAIVIDASETECLVMSLVENIARRRHSPMELMHDINRLHLRGVATAGIAQRTGLSVDYVRGILKLIKHGEERLIESVDAGEMPISVAIDIANSNSADLQRVLNDAYENGLLRGKKLLAAKRLIEKRYEQSPVRRPAGSKNIKPLTAGELVRTHEAAAEQQRLMLRRAEHTRSSIVFVVEALRVLLANEHFVTLLRAEGLMTIPASLADLLRHDDAQ